MKVTSKKPKKQRKALYNFKNHQRSKLLSTRLANFLSDEYGIKRLPLRLGDQVRICKGEFDGFEGEVIEINNKLRAKVKECVFEKNDGTQWHPTIHISNMIITKFRKEGKKMDPYRAMIIERKAAFADWEKEPIAPKKEKKLSEAKN